MYYALDKILKRRSILELYRALPSPIKSQKRHRMKRQASKKTKLAPFPVPLHTIGAGNELGLSVMLDNKIEKYFLTSGSFVGFKVSKKPQDSALD